jgi:hypothetical protein
MMVGLKDVTHDVLIMKKINCNIRIHILEIVDPINNDRPSPPERLSVRNEYC